MKPMRGNAWVFFGVLDVDWEICPREIAHELQARGSYIKEELGKYCMTKVDPDFPKKVHPGDLIVAEYMGFGHDHDHASLSILGVWRGGSNLRGVSTVLSAKFHRAWLAGGGTSGDFARCKAG